MHLIGFGHRSRMGKDTASNYALQYLRVKRPDLDIRRASFATVLKDCCRRMFAWAGVHDAAYYEANPQLRDVEIPALGMTVVELWIKFGTPMVRESLHDLTWVNCTLHTKADMLIVSDVRFPNEICAIRDKCIQTDGKSMLIKVTKAGVPHRKESIADNALTGCVDWDYILKNDGDLRDLHDNVISIIDEWFDL